jgi:tetratricopeptide (TPR) repeat protein
LSAWFGLPVCVLACALLCHAALGEDMPKGKPPKRVPQTATPDPEKPVEPAKPAAVYDTLVNGTVLVMTLPPTGDPLTGTAWLLDAERRLAVTNNHVVQPVEDQPAKSSFAFMPVVEEGEVIHEPDYYFTNGKKLGVTILYTDAHRDLALVQLDALPENAAAFKLAERSARPGEPLFSLAGAPRGSQGFFIYTEGTSRAVYTRNIAAGTEIKVLETQMPLNQGNSGGPIVNERGEIVAVFEGLSLDPGVQLVNVCVDLSELRGFLETALPLVEPKSAAVFNQRGDYHYECSRYDAALADYNAALKLDPKNAEAISNRGWVFYQRGDLDTALAEFDDALQLDPALLFARWGRGTVHRDQGRYKESIDDFTQGIRRTTEAEQLAELYNERGITYYQQENYQQALADFDRALEKKPDLVWGHANRGDALSELGRYDEAFAALDKAIALDGKEAQFWNVAGNAWYRRERYDFAVNMYSNAIQRDPNGAVYYRNRGGAYRLQSSLNEAVADLAKAVELAPSEDEYHNELGLAWYDAGRYDLAAQAFGKAIELNASDPIYFQNRGDCLQKQGQHQQAVADFNKAIAIDDTPELRAMRGRSHQALGDAQAARDDFKHATENDDSYEVYDRTYIKVSNESSGKITVHLQYYTFTTNGDWQWFPSAPGGDDTVTFEFAPGESGILFHEEWKVNASRIRIWAEGEGTKWVTYRDKDYMLTYDKGYVSNTGEFDTTTIPFSDK